MRIKSDGVYGQFFLQQPPAQFIVDALLRIGMGAKTRRRKSAMYAAKHVERTTDVVTGANSGNPYGDAVALCGRYFCSWRISIVFRLAVDGFQTQAGGKRQVFILQFVSQKRRPSISP